jgi:hypothetical protein
MCCRVSIHIAAFVGLTFLTVLTADAQKFQEPTREELQMTSDPKAPGAAAVYLDREIRNDNQGHFISEYARIKVLSEQGKEWATVEVPYRPAGVDGALRHLREAIAGSGGKPIIEARTISTSPVSKPEAFWNTAGQSRWSATVTMTRHSTPTQVGSRPN